MVLASQKAVLAFQICVILREPGRIFRAPGGVERSFGKYFEEFPGKPFDEELSSPGQGREGRSKFCKWGRTEGEGHVHQCLVSCVIQIPNYYSVKYFKFQIPDSKFRVPDSEFQGVYERLRCRFDELPRSISGPGNSSAVARTFPVTLSSASSEETET